MRTIYLAGGCFWGAEKFLASLRGVTATEVGYANGRTANPTYEQVKHEGTGHAETVRVTYDETVLPLGRLLPLFFRIIDPTAVDQQGHDIGHQYRTGIYWTDPADEPVIRAALAALAGEYDAPLAVECLPLENYYTAEAYHQKYLEKNPGGYCHVPWKLIEWARTAVDASDER